MKLTKSQIAAHHKAEDLISSSSHPLSLDEREFILDNYHPAARHINSIAGAYFTPRSLAHDLSIYIPDNATVIDLCAGIGSLAYQSLLRFHSSNYYRRHRHVPIGQITCIEINPDYIAVGRRVVPEALWIRADIFSLPACIEYMADRPEGEAFDFAICNPPFGRSRSLYKSNLLPLHGSPIELNALYVASRLARCGAFILPQDSCPFIYSGQRGHTHRTTSTWSQFYRQTHIDLSSSSIDCSIYRDDWRDVSPNVEIALYDLDESVDNWPKIDPKDDA